MTRLVPVFVVALVACALAPQESTLLNECSEGTCADGACDVERALCVAPTADYEVALELIPPNSLSEMPFPAWTFAPGAAVSTDLALPPHVDLVGTLRWRGERVPAELIFTYTDAIGRQVRTRASTLPEAQTIGEIEADFVVRLGTNRMYEVEVRPSSATMPGSDQPWLRALPPLRVLQVETPAYDPEAPANFVWPVELGWPEELSTPCGGGIVAGCTLTGVVVSPGDEAIDIPEANLQVRAVDVATGRIVSSTALTREDGSFEIVTAPDAERYLLRVNRGTERELFPTVSVDPAFLFGGEARIQVPSVPEVDYRGIVETDRGERVSSATLRFTSMDVFDDGVGLTGSYSTTVETNGRGEFDATLLAGTYEIVVTPSDATRTVFAEALRIMPPPGGGAIQGQRFELVERAHFGGVVHTADGEPVAGVPVSGQALQVPDEETLTAAFNRSSETVIDETGQFDLRLDRGVYDVTIKTPVDTRYPWIILPGERIGNLDAPLVTPLTLGAPVVLRGQVTHVDGTSSAGGEVRAHGRTEDGRFVEVGRATIAADGTYELLLPPTL